MQARKAAGVALAVGVCALGFWFASSTPHSVRSARDAGVVEKSALPQDAAVVRIARAVDAGTQEITLDAALVRRAVRNGELHFVLDDGSTYPVRIERNYTDATGHWNIVGRAETKLGEQPMVLTFGRDAVFGVVPLPNGRMLRVTSGRKGVVSIAPAAGIVPGAATEADIGRDVVFPPQTVLPTQPTKVIAATHAHTHTQSRADIAIPLGDAAVAAAEPVAGLPPQPTDTAPQTIKLLVLYGPDMVTLRGSDSAARTEIANLVALTNQAHIDSGSIVRFDALIQAGDVSATEANETLLFNTGWRYENARNAIGADLVSIVRAHLENDPTCGIAFTPNFGLQRRGALRSEYGYSIVSISDDPNRGCGPLVMPHELGHNLGAMHDRHTDRTQGNDYLVMNGSYWFSSGYRTNEFADIMAYPEFRPWAPYFSSPRITRCANKPCGVEDSEDTVRTFNLMAAQIAAFRGTPGTVSVADSEAIEPTFAPTYHMLEVRLTGAAPAGGLGLQITPAGGTATEGVDYTFPSGTNVLLSPGTSTATFAISVLPDPQLEDTEFALFNVTAQPGYSVDFEDAQTRFDIVDRDARREHVEGRVWFPSGMSAPTQPISAHLSGVDGAFSEFDTLLQPPDFAFAYDMPHGSQARILPTWPDPFAMLPAGIEAVRAPGQWNLYPQKGIRISGTLRAAAGMVMPPTPFYLRSYNLSRQSELQNLRVMDQIEINGPEYSFSKLYPPSTSVILGYDEPTPAPGNSVRFGELLSYDWAPVADVHHDFVLSEKPSLAPFEAERSPWSTGGVPIVVSSPAPPGGVTYRCRFEDGTAKAGVDYTADMEVVTVPEGRQGFTYCGSNLTVLRNDNKRTVGVIYVVIDQVVGATLTSARSPIRIKTAYSYSRSGGPGQADPAH